ncbi:hypothetical protein [Rubritalea tangerina]
MSGGMRVAMVNGHKDHGQSLLRSLIQIICQRNVVVRSPYFPLKVGTS